MKLEQEQFEFLDKNTNKLIKGVRYFVFVCGVKVYLQCKENTGKQLLDANYGK